MNNKKFYLKAALIWATITILFIGLLYYLLIYNPVPEKIYFEPETANQS